MPRIDPLCGVVAVDARPYGYLAEHAEPFERPDLVRGFTSPCGPLRDRPIKLPEVVLDIRWTRSESK